MSREGEVSSSYPLYHTLTLIFYSFKTGPTYRTSQRTIGTAL